MKANRAPGCPSFAHPKPSVVAWLGALLRASFALCLVIHSANGGTWTSVTNNAPGPIQLMLLLTDGTVMCSDSGTTSNWFKLTPDAKGNYANGTWTNLAPMGFTRRYYSSQVLQNGKVMVAGAEYGTGAGTTELYDPISNTWTQVTVPAGLLCACPQGDGTGGAFRDAGSILLPDGKMMSAPVFPATNKSTVIYDPVANTWSAGTISLGSQNEASWVKLPDDSILTIDLQNPAPSSVAAERFIPSLNAWFSDSNAPVALYDAGAEIGGALLLPDGRAMFFGGNTNTAFYTPSGNTNRGTWAAGPVLPNGQACPDAPAAMLVNGNVLIATSPFNATNSYPLNVSFYEYDTVSNTFARQADPTGGLIDTSISVYQTAFLCLPDGSVLYSRWANNLFVYTPSGPIITQGKPTIRSVSLNVDGSLHLTGTKFNGLSMGATYGDDLQMDSNYPLVRFIDADGNVRYGRTYNWSSTGVATGTNIVSTDCTLPAGASFLDTIQVVANGNASDGVSVLSVALETPTLPWISGGTTNWRNQITVTHDGADAAQSGSITDNQSSYMEATVTGPGTLSFWWKVSSETNFDYLRFAVDGNVSNSISGNVDWQLITAVVPAGDHTLRWTYSKDVSVSVGSDAGWVDQVSFAPALPVALDTPSFTWTTGGNTVWAGEMATTHDGVDAAESGDINNFQTNYIETTVSGPGAVTFWWKVSSETNYDFLRFYLDGVEQAGAPGISGEVPWQQKTVVIPPIPAGSHTLRWTYAKDVSLSVGADAGWVDQVVFVSSEVTVAYDSGPGSLRQTIADLSAGATIVFATNLSGSTIALTNGRLLLDKNLTIDASALPGGITLSGNGASRAFYIQPGVTGTLNNLTITGCVAVAQPLPGYGGAIFLEGSLNMTNCLLANNNASIAGGALLVRTTGAAVMNNCTFTQNSSPIGGAIQAEGTLTANNSTFGGNTGTSLGGAINVSFTPSVALNFCTVSGNSSATGSGLNLGANAALTTIYNSIIAGNTGAGANIAGAFTSTGANLTTGNPLLAPLGNYGGRTPTMPPLPGSPVINAGGPTSLATDQRGYARTSGPAADIGAVEVASVVVSLADDNSNTSLRRIIQGSAPGQTNIFDPTLSGGTIVLTNGQIDLNRSLTIDGSALPSGITISGNNFIHISRLFEVISGSATLNSLTLTNGNALFSTGLGGGVLVDSNATLIVNNCSILGNVANYGGGILSQYGKLTLNNSTLFGNTAVAFGALGGGIYNFEGTLAMTNCTVVGNSASNSASYAGGVRSTAGTVLFNTIICSNVAPNLPNLFAPSFSGTNNLIDGSPLLASLGNYGGPTPTLPPLTGSPVIDAGSDAAASLFATDQRGLPRLSGLHVDIGAAEFQTTLITATNPPTLINLTRLGNGAFQFGFTNIPGASFTVLTATNVALPLTNWTALGAPTEAPPGTYQFTDLQATNIATRFYRVRSP